jgi:hypothetical protein
VKMFENSNLAHKAESPQRRYGPVLIGGNVSMVMVEYILVVRVGRFGAPQLSE